MLQVMTAVPGGQLGDVSLCLCEYDNMDGQRQHVLAMCCDCEALDTACDRSPALFIPTTESICVNKLVSNCVQNFQVLTHRIINRSYLITKKIANSVFHHSQNAS